MVLRLLHRLGWEMPGWADEETRGPQLPQDRTDTGSRVILRSGTF